TSETYTLSLHDALPIFAREVHGGHRTFFPGQTANFLPGVEVPQPRRAVLAARQSPSAVPQQRQAGDRRGMSFEAANQLSRRRVRSEEHTSELQSRSDLV